MISAGVFAQSYVGWVITFLIANNLLFTEANVLLSCLTTLVSPFHISFYISDIPHSDCLVCLNMPMTFHLVVYPVHTSMLIINAVWILLLIGPVNERCRLTHQKDLMCFSLSSLNKHIVLTSSVSSLPVNGTSIPQAQKLKYLGVNLSFKLKWSDHISFVFTKVRKHSFYVRQHWSLSTSQFPVERFAFCCILAHILNCSPVVFFSILSKHWKIISRCSKLIDKCCGISLSRLQEFVISKHLSSCEIFASKILSDVQHTLHSFLSNSRLSRPSRTSYKNIYACTNCRVRCLENTLYHYLSITLVLYSNSTDFSSKSRRMIHYWKIKEMWMHSHYLLK